MDKGYLNKWCDNFFIYGDLRVCFVIVFIFWGFVSCDLEEFFYFNFGVDFIVIGSWVNWICLDYI